MSLHIAFDLISLNACDEFMMGDLNRDSHLLFWRQHMMCCSARVANYCSLLSHNDVRAFARPCDVRMVFSFVCIVGFKVRGLILACYGIAMLVWVRSIEYCL